MPASLPPSPAAEDSNHWVPFLSAAGGEGPTRRQKVGLGISGRKWESPLFVNVARPGDSANPSVHLIICRRCICEFTCSQIYL